jgi:hypothetical protein
MLCNTVQQEGVPIDWYKWNLFPYSLADKAKRWHSLASFEVEGNWNRLVKKFCEKIFPISRVQNVRKEVINFAQGEEEGIDQAWERFHRLIKQGPRLGFSGDVLLRTFYFSLTPECMRYVQMCACGNIMEKPLTKATQLLQRISEGVAMQRDWEEHISGSVEQETCVEVLAGMSRKEAPKVKKEEARQEKIEGATHNEGGPIQGIKIRKLEELQGRSLANSKPLKEFEQMDWIPINFEEIFNKRRPCPNQKESMRAIEFIFPRERHSGYELDKESAGEIIQRLFNEEEEVDPDHIAEVKRIMGLKSEASPYAQLAEVYTIGADHVEGTSLPTPHISCNINGKKICKALCDIGAQVSIMTSKIYYEIFSKTLNLAPTQIKLIMGDGRTKRPLGVLRDLDVAISG